MSMEQLAIYEAEKALAKNAGQNYRISCPNGEEVMLKRGVDFGVIPGTKQPSLLKAGAEKICMTYGLLQHYTIESKIEQFEKTGLFFYYMVKCELVKISNDGREYIFTTGYGSANTAESRNGKAANSPNVINSTVKMAQKRALVAAALSISGLSDMFTQDMENADFMEKANDMRETMNPDATITNAQLTRIFAIASENGFTAPEAKAKIKALGFNSTKDIKQRDYNAVCDLFMKNA